MTFKHLGTAALAAAFLATPALAQEVDTTTTTTETVPVEREDDNGEWGLLGLLGLAGLAGLKRRDNHHDTRATGTSSTTRM